MRRVKCRGELYSNRVLKLWRVKAIRTVLLIVLCSGVASGVGFVAYSITKVDSKSEQNISIAFYNVENLFDTTDNIGSGDDEYTPKSGRAWNEFKLNEKVINIAKVMIAAGGGTPPDIIALAEVESRATLEKLVKDTPLLPFNYSIIHHESADHRGIDVAIIYRDDNIEALNDTIFRPVLRGRSSTRDILLSNFRLKRQSRDTLSIFVNHWVSRYGGYSSTQPLRNTLGDMLREEIDGIWNIGYRNIIAVGDFNDTPKGSSVKRHLLNSDGLAPLINLSEAWSRDMGTLKYRGKWDIFDQIIVSEPITDSNNRVTIKSSSIYSNRFILEEDTKYLGVKPKRSYIGYKYHSGFSDHLPVLLKLTVK